MHDRDVGADGYAYAKVSRFDLEPPGDNRSDSRYQKHFKPVGGMVTAEAMNSLAHLLRLRHHIDDCHMPKKETDMFCMPHIFTICKSSPLADQQEPHE